MIPALDLFSGIGGWTVIHLQQDAADADFGAMVTLDRTGQAPETQTQKRERTIMPLDENTRSVPMYVDLQTYKFLLAEMGRLSEENERPMSLSETAGEMVKLGIAVRRKARGPKQREEDARG